MKTNLKRLCTGRRGRVLLALLILMAAGLALRGVACFWGNPYNMHPDEPTIVNNAIDLIARRSWMAEVYNRPDHFEIKCCALLFQLYSVLRYHLPADLAFEAHTFDFYLIARLYTAFFGVLMIPLANKMSEKCRRGAGMYAAALTAFLPLFVEHSAYATPDIVLTFFVMLVGCLSMLYLERPTLRLLVGMSVATGLGITVKYTCAICCLWIAFAVVYQIARGKPENRRWQNVIGLGMLAALAVLVTCFVMAPNLFTELPKTVATLKREARSTHLGADGLGFLGNLWFYFSAFFSCVGWEALPLFALGLWQAVRSRNRACWVLGLGGCFWVCTGVLALHWVRWGMPVYIFFVFLVALGMQAAVEYVRRKIPAEKPASLRRCAGAVLALWLGVLFLNSGVTAATYAANRLEPDTRVQALAYCREMGITEDNAVYESYTPLSMRYRNSVSAELELDAAGKLQPTEKRREKGAEVSYIVISSGMYNRYYAQADRYPQETAIYDAVNSQCRLLAVYAPEPDIGSPWAAVNLAAQLRSLPGYAHPRARGFTIKIYEMPKS